MSTQSINYIDVLSPSINFTIRREDELDLNNYTLSWNGGQIEGSHTYTNAKIVPVKTPIVFTPIFTIPKNNEIIQWKWSFGDGTTNIVSSVDNNEIVGQAIFSEGVDSFLFTSEEAPIVGQEIINSKILPGTKILAVDPQQVVDTYLLTIDTETLESSSGSIDIRIGPAISIVHTYSKGLAPLGSTGCLIATLTAIDKYQRHTRAYKTIHLQR